MDRDSYNPNPKNCMFVLHVVGLRDGAILFIRHGCGMGGIHVIKYSCLIIGTVSIQKM